MPKTAPEAPAPTEMPSRADYVEEEAEQVAGDAGDQVDGNQADRTKQRFAEQTEVPQTPHVGGDVKQADVNEGRGEQPPPLAVQKNERSIGGAIVDQLCGCGVLRRDTVQDHPAEDGDVDGEQDVGAGRGEDVPAALAGVGTRGLALVVRHGRASGGVRRKKFAVRLGSWRSWNQGLGNRM